VALTFAAVLRLIAEVAGDAGGVEARGSRVHDCPRPLATSANKDQIDGEGTGRMGVIQVYLGGSRCGQAQALLGRHALVVDALVVHAVRLERLWHKRSCS
jgi:hypothetical protein